MNNKQRKKPAKRASRANGGNKRLLPGDGTSPQIGRVIRNGNTNSIFCVTGTYQAAPMSNVSGFGAYYALAFTADSLPTWSALSSIFDRYRIKLVDVNMQAAVNQINTTSNITMPMFHTVVDFDDATVPSSINALQSFSTYCGIIGNKSIRRRFVPRSGTAMYISGVSQGYGETSPLIWKDVANGNIPHYGLKTGFDGPSTASGTCTYTVEVRLMVEFAGIRG